MKFQLCRPRVRIMMMGTIRHALSAAFFIFVTEYTLQYSLVFPLQYFTMVNVEQLVEEIIKTNKVAVFSKSYCRKFIQQMSQSQ